MKKERNLGFVYFLVFTFLALCIFGGLGFYSNVITGAAINPASDFSRAVSNLIKDNETVAVILTFVILLSLFFVLVEKTHIFKDNKRAGIIFSSAATLIAIIFTPLVDWMLYLVSYAFWAIVFVTFLIIFFAVYLFLHKNVSTGIGELADVASRRDTKMASALGAKTSRIQAKGPEISAKSNLKSQKTNLTLIAQLERKWIKLDKEIKSLNAIAAKTGKIRDSDVIDLLGRLDNDVRIFKGYMNSGNVNEANNIYTSIAAHLGQLSKLVRK